MFTLCIITLQHLTLPQVSRNACLYNIFLHGKLSQFTESQYLKSKLSNNVKYGMLNYLIASSSYNTLLYLIAFLYCELISNRWCLIS